MRDPCQRFRDVLGFRPIWCVGHRRGVLNQQSPVWVNVGSGLTAESLAYGQMYGCVVLSNGSLKCWGYNANGQLGDGTTANKDAPVAISLGTGRTAEAVAVHNAHTCAILDDGSVKCWGDDTYGELGNGAGVTHTVHLLRQRRLISAQTEPRCPSTSAVTIPAPFSTTVPSSVGVGILMGNWATEQRPLRTNTHPSRLTLVLIELRLLFQQAGNTPAPFSTTVPSSVGVRMVMGSWATELRPLWTNTHPFRLTLVQIGRP